MRLEAACRCTRKRSCAYSSRARGSGGDAGYASHVRDSLGAFWREELLHYSVLIASYAQGAILLCIVGQELHDHQSPGLPQQEKLKSCEEG
jgi:hypothetical protein